MKRIVTTLLIAASGIMLLAGCKGKDKVANDPKTVLVTFFERMSKKDIDGAAKLVTKESKGTMDMMKKAMDMGEKMKDKTDTLAEKDPAEDFKNMQFGEAKIDGDKATVSVSNPAKENKIIDFPLKKEDGDWKVDFSMGTLMKMGKDQGGNKGFQVNEYPDDTLNNKMDDFMNSDSLKRAMEMLDSALKNMDPEKMKEMKDAMKELEKLKDN